ncbi:hypothetical protein [Cupriavidus pauculus]|uniref:hypothetical protein n=1 Tax=Cupriavidus pauculus TaxID=82633 RepID=UPI0030F5E574
MTYTEFINAALRGRSVNKAAHEMGLPQPTLSNYKLGKHLPSPLATLILAKEAGMSEGEALRVLAEEEATRKGMLDKIKQLFKSARRAAKLSLA